MVSEYTNRFSSSQATIIAQMNFGTEWSYAYNELDFPLNLMVKLKQWSDVVYNGIIGTINKQGYAAFRPFNIKHVFRHNLIDKGVIAVLQSVIESDTPKRQWPGSQFAISTPQARAVLSVANAKGIWWMLASHKEALGEKAFSSH
ncbi:hypothetical protein HII31_13737 [Pseudocercospora fuligena]|uniref:Uncharacterized protein n=1 Tax=Pseudocercospora fuligena TaxID=685502 RepID=A0A8H6VFE2_9PEZI|nr:hypothetical protein HII31_13737 [Pseudocercospora fuligena]